jgi:hypothetical protein
VSELRVIRLNGSKSFPIGARPGGLSFQWLKDDGDPIDMSVGVWTGQARASALDGTAAPANLGDGVVAVDTDTATAVYSWHDDDFSVAGRFRIILWVGNGSERWGSTVFEYEVVDAPGDDPTV